MTTDCKYMKSAIKEAQKAKANNEVPIGAVVVLNDSIIGRGYNQREKNRVATHHAEVIAINKACKKQKDWRLLGATLYVTVEPCMMCLGAAINARIEKVVFGAFDPNGKQQKEQIVSTLNHNLLVVGGVMEKECKQLVQEFFKQKRK